MSKIREIAELGNPILRAIAQPVTKVHDQRIQQLIDEMLATVAPANGVGIAAPQLAESHRMFILASRPTLRYPHAPTMEPTAIINPHIIDRSDEMVKDWEGCLSVPGLRGLVPRNRAIEVEYTDRYGKLHQQEFSDFVARIFQHEYDHLEGIVFLDRVESTREIMSDREYQKQLVQHL
ncbi:peptide deformylase [Phormidium sp. CCY1219]|jgi:peptide deformylase|uniref:peptide deformylase n=1 Tax=Phormidium sp. CCY1219 TaxID=2886104 RepID=UPI002D1F94DF|nr:peptide deformylase [Phormidium sp. CCY1219]MEB3830554.1 peptide deformylase [Phormidium sp. CCY1219]